VRRSLRVRLDDPSAAVLEIVPGDGITEAAARIVVPEMLEEY
jgi:hypothetical protein